MMRSEENPCLFSRNLVRFWIMLYNHIKSSLDTGFHTGNATIKKNIKKRNKKHRNDFLEP